MYIVGSLLMISKAYLHELCNVRHAVLRIYSHILALWLYNVQDAWGSIVLATLQ